MDVISGRTLLARLGEDEVVVVDCRSDAERERLPLQIPGAIHMSCDEIHASPLVLPDDELIVLYDSEGVSSGCRRAARILELAGRSTAILEGGLRAWLQHGYPTETRSMRRSSQEAFYFGIEIGSDPR